MFLGAHVARMTGRKMDVWMGECHVHAGISPQDLKARVDAEPGAEVLVHPECGCSTQAIWLMGEGVLPEERTKILSTGGMVNEAARTPAEKFLVATETRTLHQLREGSPGKVLQPINEYAVCQYMKAITPEKLLRSLRDGVYEITVPEDVRVRAAQSVERMIAITPDTVPVP